MADETLQFIYKVGAVFITVAMLGILAAMIGGIFYFGDGEGLAILNSLSGPFLALLGTIIAIIAPHQIASAVKTVKSTAAGSVVPVGPGIVQVGQPTPAAEPTSDPAGLASVAAVTGAGVD